MRNFVLNQERKNDFFLKQENVLNLKIEKMLSIFYDLHMNSSKSVVQLRVSYPKVWCDLFVSLPNFKTFDSVVTNQKKFKHFL